MVAPSVLAQFKQPVEKVFGALKVIGFDDVIEVAYGAEETIRNEAEGIQGETGVRRGIHDHKLLLGIRTAGQETCA